MACYFQNIKIVEGNAFALLLPLVARYYTIEGRPNDEDIDCTQLENCKVTIGSTEYDATLTTEGVVTRDEGTLARGTYDIVLTATYQGYALRADWFEGVTIVKYNHQSNAEQYIHGSPIVMRPAFCIMALGDTELQNLKQQLQQKIAETEQAKEAYEQAKVDYDARAEALDDVAKQSTLTSGVQTLSDKIDNIDIDTSTLAKQGTNPDANISDIQAKIGTPASGQPATLFGAIRDVALSAQTLDSLAASWAEMVTRKTSLSGWVLINGQVVNGVGDLITKYLTSLLSVYDESVVNFNRDSFFGNCTTVERIELPNLEYVNAYSFYNCTNLKEIAVPNVNKIGISTSNYTGQFSGCTRLEKIELPLCVYISSYHMFFGCTSLRRVSFSHNMQEFVTPSGGDWFNGCVNLIDLEFGYLTGDVRFTASWNPTNALLSNSQTLLTTEDIAAGFTNNLEKLLYNIREHIAAYLPVATNTITFSAAVKAAILADQPTANAFTNKNWIIA